MRSPLPLAILGALLGSSLVSAQVPFGHFALSSVARPGTTMPVGIEIADPLSGAVRAIASAPGQAQEYDFQDVLIETGSGNLFVAGAASGSRPGQIEYWTLSGFTKIAVRPCADLRPREIAAMSFGPFASLWVLTTDPANPGSGGDLYQVDPGGTTPPRLTATWSRTEGSPGAICSDGRELFVACDDLSAPGPQVLLWRVQPGAAKLPIAFSPGGALPGRVNDLAYVAASTGLELSIRSGGNYLIDIASGAWNLNWLSSGEENLTNLAPADGLFFFVGPGPGAAYGEATITRWESPHYQQIAIQGIGDLTSVHLDESWSPDDSSFSIFPPRYSCEGSAGPCLVGDCNGPPNLGNGNYELIFHLSRTGTSGVLFAGLSNSIWQGVRLPLDLEPLGTRRGCKLLVSAEAQFEVLPGANPWIYPLPIPNNPALIGGSLYFQLWIRDPAGGSLGVAGSDGAQIIFR